MTAETTPENALAQVMELAAIFETCIPFLPPVGQKNITKAVADLRQHGPHFATLAEKCRRLEGENAELRTVMIAAAEEIHEHWAAHCDAEGYGPANLMRRLEQGIAVEYGYKAGDFERIKQRAEHAEAQRDAAVKDAERYRWLHEHFEVDFSHYSNDWLVISGSCRTPSQFIGDAPDELTLDAVIDAMANSGEPK